MLSAERIFAPVLTTFSDLIQNINFFTFCSGDAFLNDKLNSTEEFSQLYLEIEMPMCKFQPCRLD